MMFIVEGREVIPMGIYGHGWGMMAGMFLFWALVLGAGLWLLARLFPAARAPQAQDHNAHAQAAPVALDPAVQVVRQRYASGEISKSEYEEVLRILERTTPLEDASPREVQEQAKGRWQHDVG
ncbi:MAG: SHOCT domain-containing protein [Nitrososphaerales archaeon]